MCILEMGGSMKFSCYIIGNDSLLIQCIEILQYYNHNVLGIFTSDNKVKTWAKNHEISILDSLQNLAQKAESMDYDYLVVLDHDINLPPSLAKSPKKGIITFRNTLLKCNHEYAAAQLIWSNLHLNSVAWCIGYSTGTSVTVLWKHDIVIDEYETTLTLNLKMYESAVITFRGLIRELSTVESLGNSEITKLIDVNPLYDITLNSKLINWRYSADSIFRLYRALQFGAYINKIGLLMFLIQDTIFIPNEMRIVTRDFQCKPGSVTAISNNYLQISTAKNDIRIYSVSDLTGRIWSIQEIVERFNLTDDDRFGDVFRGKEKHLKQLTKQAYVNENFWLNYLDHITSVKLIPSITSQNKFSDKVRTESKIINMPHETTKALIKKFNVGCSDIWLAIVLLYLYRVNNTRKFSIKLHGIMKPLKGVPQKIFSKDIIFTCDFSNCESFKDVLSYIKQQVNMLVQHGNYRQDIFLRNSVLLDKLRRVKNYINLTSALEDDVFTKEHCYGFSITKEKLQFTFLSSFMSDIRNKTFFSNICLHLLALLEDLAKNPKKSIHELSILSQSEFYQITKEWNVTSHAYPKDKLIHKLFEEQVAKTPDSIAAVFGNQKLSYSDLNKKANKLARYLKATGMQERVFVAVILKRSLHMIISILGILKAGGAYVPIAPSYPADRIQYILKNNCSLAIVDNNTLMRSRMIAKELVNVVSLDDDEPMIVKEADNNLTSTITSDGLVYVLYTSGTTDKPKGVQISHRSLVNHMCWMTEKFQFDKKDIVLQKTPFTFDASVWELFMPILIGGTLIFASQYAHTSPPDMISEIQKHKVTTLQLVPSILRELLKLDELKDCNSLRQIFSGGELLSSEIKQQFFNLFKNIKLHNLYGPTEATIEVTSHTCINSKEDIALNIIGKPINNTKVYILDRNLEIVPIGVSGELYIGGDCLSAGYVNSIELTHEKFIPDKFSSDKSAKLYRTGDLARWLPDGNIEIIGRADNQVKIRGFRIEITEIENNILLHSAIKQCAVVAKKDSLGFDFLVAYLESDNKEKAVNGDIVKDFLQQKLPKYMIPSMFIFLEYIPLTFHGKVDRKQLPSPDICQIRQSHDYIEPSTTDEIKIAEVWKEILEINRIGVEDDFFSLGGHSLSVLQLLTRIENVFNVKISMKDFINNSTISKLSKFITNIKKSNNKHTAKKLNIIKSEFTSPIVPLKKKGSRLPLFLIHPVGGTIFWYISLAKFLDAGRPIYAIQDPGLIHKDIKLQSIEDMATFYLKFIKEIQPHGPYLIGGASFGSTVAIEIANQLRASNENTIFIPLLDGWAFYPDNLLDPEIFKETMERQYAALRAKFATSGIATNAKDLLNLQHYRLNMLWKYKMDKITHPLVLFKSQELLPVFKTIDSPNNHWDKYVINPVNVHVVPGNHETMFQSPNVHVLASKLRDSLSFIQDSIYLGTKFMSREGSAATSISTQFGEEG